jgi:hypothetical protein
MKKNELKSLLRGYCICICIASGLLGLAAGATEAANRTRSRGQGISPQVIDLEGLKSYVGEIAQAAANRRNEKKPETTTESVDYYEFYYEPGIYTEAQSTKPPMTEDESTKPPTA